MELLISSVLSTGIVLISTALIYFALKRVYDAPWVRDMPCAKGIFPFGHAIYFLMNMRGFKNGPHGASALHALIAMAKQFEEDGMFVIKGGWKNLVFLFAPETVEPVLKSTTEIKKSMFYQPLKSVLGEGLITSSGDEKWKIHRKTMNPAFHLKMLEGFQEIMSKHALVMVDKINKMKNGKPIAMQPLFGPCTFDIIMESATGKCMNAQLMDDSKVLHSIDRFMEIAAERIYHPWLFPSFLFTFFKTGRESIGHSTYTVEFFREVLNERRELYIKNAETEQSDERPCVLDVLLDNHLKKLETFSENEVIHELENIVIPGYETVQAALSYAVFLIGNNPEIQKKIHDELDDIFGTDTTREITSQDFLKMKYMECVVKECLRLFPPVPIIARTLKEDIKIEGRFIPKGTDVVVFSPPIHKSKKHYDKPEHFIPERFLPENSKDRHPYAFIPFSSGPRNCIGGGFAQRALRNILAAVLRSFEIKATDAIDTLHINFATIGRPHKPVTLTVQSRHVLEAY